MRDERGVAEALGLVQRFWWRNWLWSNLFLLFVLFILFLNTFRSSFGFLLFSGRGSFLILGFLSLGWLGLTQRSLPQNFCISWRPLEPLKWRQVLVIFFLYTFVLENKLFDGDLLQISIHPSCRVNHSALGTFVSVSSSSLGLVLIQAVLAEEDVALITASGVDWNRFANQAFEMLADFFTLYDFAAFDGKLWFF